jgi:hypothetical protein
MRPRVSEDALEALLREGDPAQTVNPVTDSERAAFQALLMVRPREVIRSPRRLVGSVAVVLCGSALVGWGILRRLPDQKPVRVIILPPAPAQTRSAPAPTRSAPAPTRSAPAPTRSAPAPTRSALALTRSALAPTRSALAPTRSALAPTRSALAPTRSEVAPEPVITHVLISADSTCTPEMTAPPTERITIRGDATSVVAVTESLSTTNEETKEVSL